MAVNDQRWQVPFNLGLLGGAALGFSVAQMASLNGALTPEQPQGIPREMENAIQFGLEILPLLAA